MADMAVIASYGLNIVKVVAGMLGIIVVFGLVTMLILYIKNMRRYKQYEMVIFEKDGLGQYHQSIDNGGIFEDKKTNNKLLYMKKNNVGMNPDNIPYVTRGNKKIVYCLRSGLKNFSFIKFNIGNPTVNLDVGEEDVNWAINAYERQKKMFQDSIWMQILPYAVIAFTSIIILILFYYFFQKFDVLQDVARSLAKAAESIQQANSGTTVIG